MVIQLFGAIYVIVSCWRDSWSWKVCCYSASWESKARAARKKLNAKTTIRGKKLLPFRRLFAPLAIMQLDLARAVPGTLSRPTSGLPNIAPSREPHIFERSELPPSWLEPRAKASLAGHHFACLRACTLCLRFVKHFCRNSTDRTSS